MLKVSKSIKDSQNTLHLDVLSRASEKKSLHTTSMIMVFGLLLALRLNKDNSGSDCLFDFRNLTSGIANQQSNTIPLYHLPVHKWPNIWWLGRLGSLKIPYKYSHSFLFMDGHQPNSVGVYIPFNKDFLFSGGMSEWVYPPGSWLMYHAMPGAPRIFFQGAELSLEVRMQVPVVMTTRLREGESISHQKGISENHLRNAIFWGIC